MELLHVNGSGGAGPKVEVGLEKTTFTYTIHKDVLDTDLNPCGNGNTRFTLEDGDLKVCEVLETNREEKLIDHYSVEDFEIACEDSETFTTVFTCNPVTTTNDIRAFETISQVQITGYGAPLVDSINEFEYRIAGAEDIGIIF